MKYKVIINDTDQNKVHLTLVETRSDASVKRVVLKGIEQVVSDISSDEVEFMREVNYIYRESCDEDDFMEQLKLDLDLEIKFAEL